LLIFSAMYGYRAFKQWQQDKSSKHYLKMTVASLMCLILFIGLVFIAYPREFHQTFDVMMYSGQSDQGEKATVEIRGQTWQNLLYGQTFLGTIELDDTEFLILQYREEPAEIPFIDRL